MNSSNPQHQIIYFDKWKFDQSSHTLFEKGVDGQYIERELEAVCSKVLSNLIDNQSKIVSRNQLLEEVWHVTGVTDERVTRAISQLRTALGDDIKVPKYIVTHPKRGYQFIGSKEPKSRKPIRKLVGLFLGGFTTISLFLFYLFVVQGLDVIDDEIVTYELLSTELAMPNTGSLSISHDSKYLVFSSAKETETADKKPQITSSLMIQDLVNGNSKKIKSINGKNIWGTSISKSDYRIIYFQLEHSKSCEAWMMQLDPLTTNVIEDKKVFDCNPVIHFGKSVTWSKDGRFVYFTESTKNSNNLAVFKYDTQNGKRTQITTPPHDSKGDLFVQVDDDSSDILFLRFNSKSQDELWIIKNSSEQKLIHTFKDALAFADFHPNGFLIIDLMAKHSYILSSDGKNIKTIGNFSQRENHDLMIDHVIYNHDKKFAFVMAADRYKNFIIKTPNPFITNARSREYLNEDLNFLYDASGADRNIKVRSSEDEVSIYASTPKGEDVIIRRFPIDSDVKLLKRSYDGSQLLYSVEGELWVSDLQGNHKMIPTADKTYISHSWSSKPSNLYAINIKDDYQLVMIDTQTSQTNDVEGGVRYYKESNDGKHVLVVKSNSNKLYLRNIEKGTDTVIPLPDFDNQKKISAVFHNDYVYIKCAFCNVPGTELAQLVLRYDLKNNTSDINFINEIGKDEFFEITSDGSHFIIDSSKLYPDKHLSKYRIKK